MSISPEFYARMRKLAASYDVKIKMPVQQPRPPGHQPYPIPPFDVIFIDYITLLPKV